MFPTRGLQVYHIRIYVYNNELKMLYMNFPIAVDHPHVTPDNWQKVCLK